MSNKRADPTLQKKRYRQSKISATSGSRFFMIAGREVRVGSLQVLYGIRRMDSQ